MKKFLKERYHLHLAGGAIAMIGLFLFSALTRYLDPFFLWDIGIYFDSLRVWELGIIGFFISTIVGLKWEMYHYFKGAPFDKWDVIWTGIGGVIISIIYNYL